MSDLSFYAAMLRFVANKTAPEMAHDARGTAMMAALVRAGTCFEAGQPLRVPAAELELTARAFAGFAAFLQKQILPEAVAYGNEAGEKQVRWAVDTGMATVSLLLSRAALQEGQDVELPPPLS